VELCGVRTETCPSGFKTGDQILPPGGYVGGGLQMQTDLAISPAGDVWVMDNWQDIDSCFGVPPEALSTRCGGQGVTIFFGMAKPVAAPQIGPARPLGERDSDVRRQISQVRRCAGIGYFDWLLRRRRWRSGHRHLTVLTAGELHVPQGAA
jgi:hypothetical protein